MSIIPSEKASSVKSRMESIVLLKEPSLELTSFILSSALLAVVSSVYLLARVQWLISNSSPDAFACIARNKSLLYNSANVALTHISPMS